MGRTALRRRTVHQQTPQGKVLFCGNIMQKHASLQKFTCDPTHNLLLLSTLNSGSGCDLSIAKRVILLTR